MKNENQDIVGEKYIKDDDSNLAFDDKSKLAAWKYHYEKLPNVEFPWTVTPCLKNSHFKDHLLGSPLRWLVNHCRR